MPSKAYRIKIWFLALLVSPILVLPTLLIQNHTLTFFPTYDYGISRNVAYGLPFAFREVVFLVDTSYETFHWGVLLMNVCLVTPVLLILEYLMIRANLVHIE